VNDNVWRRCSACKNPILHRATYWVCSVSTCNRKRTGMGFCTVSCWEVHLPVANHREAWAVEEKAPNSGSYVEQQQSSARAPAKPAPRPAPSRPAVEPVSRSAGKREPDTPTARQAPPSERSADKMEEEILIVVSKMKDYIRWKSGYNTSDRVAVPLSAILRKACDEAIETATRDERKTVLDRDVPKPR
jgi:hypothetical protein